jgi:hypothetical protein
VIVLSIIAWVFVPIAIIVYLSRSLLRLRKSGVDTDPHWYLWPFSSANDAIGQLLLAVGVSLAGIAVQLAIRHFGLPSYPSITLLAVTVAAGALGWWQRAPIVVLGTVALSFGWWAISTQRWVSDTGSTAGLATGIGVVVLALIAISVARLVELKPADKRLGFFAWLPGTLTVITALFVLSSQSGIVLLGSKNLVSPFSASLKEGAALAILFAIALGLLAFAGLRKATSLAETAALGVMLGVMLLLAFLPPRGASSGGSEYDGLFGGGGTPTLTAVGTSWAAVFNVLLLAALLGLVFLGYQRREDWLVTFGALLLFVFVLFKYFDWLFSLLDRSIAFVGAGLLFLGVGWMMERGRRSIIKAMEVEHAAE